MKKIITALLCALMVAQVVPTYAATQVVVAGNVQSISKGTVIDDEYYAPKLRVTLNKMNAYAGKTVKVVIKLEGAVWTERTGRNILCTDLKNIEIGDLGAIDMGETGVMFLVDIPSSIIDQDEISFTVPLMIETMDDQAFVSVETTTKSDSVLDKAQRLPIAVSSEKMLRCNTSERPMITEKGIMAPITFSEIYTASLSTQQTFVDVTLLNSNVSFGDIEYISKQENSDDTDYMLDGSKYVEYLEGFEGMDDDLKMKISKEDSRTLTFKLTGQAPFNEGKIVIKNIPVIVKDQMEEEELKVSIKGDGILDSGASYVVGVLRPVEKEEVIEEVQGEDEEEATKEVNEKHTVVSFTVSKNGYVKDGQYVATDTKPFVQAPGYIMVPVKSVAVALGIGEEQISYQGNTVTIQYGNKTIELLKNSNIAKLNGETKAISATAMIENGRMYVPVGEIAQLLGVDVKWDGATKTAIFTN